MKIYTAAQERGFSGQGGGHDEQMICRVGSYGSGEFPPFFDSAEKAQAYIDSCDKWPRLEVVECELVSS